MGAMIERFGSVVTEVVARRAVGGTELRQAGERGKTEIDAS